jgi:hypothetical protein
MWIEEATRPYSWYFNDHMDSLFLGRDPLLHTIKLFFLRNNLPQKYWRLVYEFLSEVPKKKGFKNKRITFDNFFQIRDLLCENISDAVKAEKHITSVRTNLALLI